MRKTSLIGIIMLLSVFCASQRFIRINAPSAVSGPPVIRALADLGSLPPAGSGEINQHMKDGRFTPGEWVAVAGDNLASPDARVNIGEIDVPVAGYLEGGSILIRIPRGLAPNVKHNLSVSTEKGKSELPVVITNYLIINDPFSGRLIFYSSLCGEDWFFDEDEADDVPMTDNICQAISPSGGLLYAVNSEGLIAGEYDLKVIHLGARKSPAEISSVRFRSDSVPAAIDISEKEDILVVLAERHLYIFSLSNPAAPALSGNINLMVRRDIMACSYKSVAVMDDGRFAAALEPSSNSISLIDISDRSNPRMVQNLDVAPGADLPLSIDISVDREDPRILRLLQGPNIRYAYRGIQELLSWDDKKEKSKTKDGMMNSRVARLELKNNLLRISEQKDLPAGFVPLFMKSLVGKKVLISGISIEFFRFVRPDLSLDGVTGLLGWLKDTIELGRIISVTDGGEIAAEAQGLSIFLCLDRIAKDGPLVYSVMKLGPRFIPPSVGVDMGVEVFDNQYFYFQKMDTESLYPPYRAPYVIVQ